jgi:predicted phosphodiesterase
MLKSMIIGDLHFNDKPKGLLEAQVSFTKKLLDIGLKEKVDRFIFLGDLMMHRRPTPSVLLALKSVIDHASSIADSIVILRGNHDSETKADDGVTALSLLSSSKTRVVCHFEVDTKASHAYIPHYEDEDRIKEALSEVPEGFTVFGHFGYNGALNSVGDLDFSISPILFNNNTILGHIHGYKQEGNITILGTPFTTNFQENKKESFYAILNENNVLNVYNIDFGIRHVQMDYENVEENLYWLNDKDYFTILRINLSSLTEDHNNITDLLEKLDIGHYEIKYKPLIDDKTEFTISDSRREVLDIGEELIEEYISSTISQIGREELLEGLKLINENQQNRDL